MLQQSTEACVMCRKLFRYIGFGPKMCQECKSRDEEQFTKVKEYLNLHKNATVMQVVVNTEVAEKDVIRYLKEGLLEIPEGSASYIQCERCGTDIKSGRYCPDCARTLSTELTSISFGLVGEKPKTSGRMRFFATDR